MKNTIYFLIIQLLISSALFSQNTIYVTQNGGGLKDGTSWDNAYPGTSLKDALFSCPANGSVWIAAGIYKPTIGTNRSTRFKLDDEYNDLFIYGGFIGNENSLEERDINKNKTIISGNIGMAGSNSDNSYTLWEMNCQNTIVDGLFFEDASKGEENDERNGAIYIYGSNNIIQNCVVQNNLSTGISITANSFIVNCIIQNNTQRGIYAERGNVLACDILSNNGGVQVDGTPYFENCKINKNISETSGGGILAEGGTFLNCEIKENEALFTSILQGEGGGIRAKGDAIFVNCTVSNNKQYNDDTGRVYGGGGIMTDNVSTSRGGNIFLNCIVKENEAAYRGSGIFCDDRDYFINCLIVNNKGREGVYIYESYGKFYNCAFWNNEGKEIDSKYNQTEIRYCAFPNLTDEIDLESCTLSNCIAISNPGFSNVTNNDFSLVSSSPLINAGSNDYLNENQYFDYIRKHRIFDGIVDIGPHEFGSYDLANLEFVELFSVTCANQAVRIPLVFHGKPPFSVEYAVNNKTETITNINTKEYELILDPISWTSNLEVTALADANGQGFLPASHSIKISGTCTTGTDVQIACESFTWIDGITYTESNNTVTDTLVNAEGCDSIITLNLLLNNNTYSTIIETSVDGYISPSGKTITESGSYTDTITNSVGCDSIISIELTIVTDISESDIGDLFTYYPNPVTSDLNIVFKESFTGWVNVYNLSGNILLNKKIEKKKDLQLPIGHLDKGMYIVKLKSDLLIISFNIILE